MQENAEREIKSYYDLATDQYEIGWSRSFHFCRFNEGEAFQQALARHEHYMAHMINIREGMRVLDVGCGVGGPTREIAAFTGCHVVGLNNNHYQIDRATQYTKKDGLSDQVSFVKGDFMVSSCVSLLAARLPRSQRVTLHYLDPPPPTVSRRRWSDMLEQNMEFPENSFDAVFVIEATVHAPSLEQVYKQIYRVLKPRGTFGVFEWVLTDKYDVSNPTHQAIRLGIERGNGISSLQTRKHAEEAIQSAGFTLEHAEDLAARSDKIRWFYPINGKFKHENWKDVIGFLRRTRIGRASVGVLIRLLELVRVAPAGTAETSHELALAADHLVAGGEAEIFTPMFFMIGKKPPLSE